MVTNDSDDFWGVPPMTSETSIFCIVPWHGPLQPIHEETAGAPQDRDVEGAQEPRRVGLGIGDHPFDEGADLRPRHLAGQRLEPIEESFFAPSEHI